MYNYTYTHYYKIYDITTCLYTLEKSQVSCWIYISMI